MMAGLSTAGAVATHQESCASERLDPLRGGGSEDLEKRLAELGQGHLFEGLGEEQKAKLLEQAAELDGQLPGGLEGYVTNARKLLKDSKEGVNPYEGFAPSVPQGEHLKVGSEDFERMEKLGREALSQTGFVLVAGGLGERLGYKGIKVSLPLYDALESECFLKLYISHILYIQEKFGKGKKIPLAIMTSDDTHAMTEKLLQDNNYFGMDSSQLTIMKQNKVPAIKDSDGHFAIKDGKIETKPHGHGDVHTLMHQTGVAKSWKDSGVKYVVFFQDTNGIIFRSLPAVLGVSVSNKFAVNSVCVPRTPGEAVGGICRLEHKDGRAFTVNVEYNQLDPLLRSTEQFSNGDVADAKTGFSPFPGNINVLVIDMDSYHSTLSSSGGRVNEFVNPKYADASKQAFKSPTRLECMMQDFPLLLSTESKVGFTTLDRWICFSPVKNNIQDAAAKSEKGLPPESAGTAERDAMALNTRMLQMAGAKIPEVGQAGTYAGIKLDFSPMVVLLPSFGTSLSDIKDRISPGASIEITSRSALVVEGEVFFEGKLKLDGALELRAQPGSSIIVKNLEVTNSGWEIVEVKQDDPSATVTQAMRGYKVVKHETRSIVADSEKKVVDEA
uniref:UTP-monosaccharide-1-phosphate uridylyltransferase n=1 Tax=Guillardia theta TaxID=55529 RepID=A0A6U6C210_GUITH